MKPRGGPRREEERGGPGGELHHPETGEDCPEREQRNPRTAWCPGEPRRRVRGGGRGRREVSGARARTGKWPLEAEDQKSERPAPLGQLAQMRPRQPGSGAEGKGESWQTASPKACRGEKTVWKPERNVGQGRFRFVNLIFLLAPALFSLQINVHGSEFLKLHRFHCEKSLSPISLGFLVFCLLGSNFTSFPGPVFRARIRTYIHRVVLPKWWHSVGSFLSLIRSFPT